MKRIFYLFVIWYPLTAVMAEDLTINSVSELQAFAVNVNAGNSYEGSTVWLTADIDLDSSAWTPIGTTAHPFNGTFDGLGHWVSNLSVNIEGTTTGNVAGLFGCIGTSATVRRVGVASGSIHISAKTSASVNCYVGGIVGLNHGTIAQCANKATIVGNWTMAAIGGIAGASGNIGGGATSATIEDCYNQGRVFTTTTEYSDGNYLGGIVGNTDGTLLRVYSCGSVTNAAHSGMIHGANAGTVSNAYSSELTGTALDGCLNTQGDYSVWTFADEELPTLTCFSVPTISLSYADDNTSTLETYSGQTVNVVLRGHTFYKDSYWNTIYLPFNIELESSALEGATVRQLSDASINGNTLSLIFGNDVTTLVAGTPYIIQWTSGDNIVNPVFCGVTINNEMNNTTHDLDDGKSITFTGTYAPVNIGSSGDNTKLYIGTDNTLYYPNATMTIASCRAYFQLNGFTAEDPVNGIKAFVLDFGSNSTGIDLITIPVLHTLTPFPNGEGNAYGWDESDCIWYSLDGKKINGQPTQKGIYVRNGRKVIIK